MGKYRLEEEEKESCLEGCFTFDPKIRLPINFFGCHLNLTADIKSFYLQKIIGTIYYETWLHMFTHDDVVWAFKEFTIIDANVRRDCMK